MFDLYKVDGPRLWMPLPAMIETMMEVFNEYRVAHPGNAHIFTVPRLMRYLWRTHLGNDDVDILITIATRDHLWDKSQHKPLILAIVLPFAYVKTYSGPWIARGLGKPEYHKKELEPGFKITGGRDPREFPDMDGTLCCLWKVPEGRSGTLLLHFFHWAWSFPPRRSAWCGDYYQDSIDNPYPRMQGEIQTSTTWIATYFRRRRIWGGIKAVETGII